MSQVSFLNNCFTEDHILLPMVHFEVENKDICVLFIHGMCGLIVDNYFATFWGDFLQKQENFFQFATIDVSILTFSGSLEEDYYQEFAFLKESKSL